eukprot:TRINITY_DN9281_c0_g1_i6.p1 TRINITY_DN9281_c0_g1~~TRINITY_DN9281_c0_g1_i6.p1  ORF type:complete len:302 (+),score=41.04 TRINITY_DN9281_c0_g1_i6:46-906(+)
MALRLEVRHAETNFGDSLAVVGSGSYLGDWNPALARNLQTSADLFPVWFIEVPACVLKEEFKLIVRGEHGQVTWEDISNRRWDLSAADIGRDGRIVHTMFNDARMNVKPTFPEQATNPIAQFSKCRVDVVPKISYVQDLTEEVPDTSVLYYGFADYFEFRAEHDDVFAPQRLRHFKEYSNVVVIEQARQRDEGVFDHNALAQVASDFSRRDVELAIQRGTYEESEHDLPSEPAAESSSAEEAAQSQTSSLSCEPRTDAFDKVSGLFSCFAFLVSRRGMNRNAAMSQ